MIMAHTEYKREDASYMVTLKSFAIASRHVPSYKSETDDSRGLY